MAPHEPPSVSMCRRGSADPGSDPFRTVVWVQGEHDIASRPDLAAAIAEAAGLDDIDLVVDLSGVTFMDASTIGAIVDGHNGLGARRRSLTVRAPSAMARRLLDVCELAFLVDQGAPQRSSTPALGPWVAVPASDRASHFAQPPLTQWGAASTRAVPVAAQRTREPVGALQQPRTPS